MDVRDRFAGKKITVMGLGLLGRGLGDARFLASCGAELIVTDMKSAAQLASSVAELAHFPNIQFVLGEHRLEDFRGRDMILKAAGVPLDSPYIAESRKEGTEIAMSASLFAEIAQIPVVGITGTRGKSTVTHMVHEIFKAAGKKTVLGGNVRGVSTLSLLPDVTPEHTAIFELDSWQMQGFGDAQMSPNIGVFTTFFPDHLNYYHGNLDAYFADKANMYLYQKEDDTIVLGSQVAPLVKEKHGSQILSHIVVVGEEHIPADWKLQVLGVHNRYNAGIARAVAQAAGISDDVIRSALEKFKAVPGRLELIREVNGVSIYNDTNSTTPDATLVALDALQEAGMPTILIIGGADKQLDMSTLVERLQSLKHVALLAGSGTERIKDSLQEASVFNSLSEALTDAMAHAESGDAVVLSPAFASFGMFKNEYDRGDQFTELVHLL